MLTDKQTDGVTGWLHATRLKNRIQYLLLLGMSRYQKCVEWTPSIQNCSDSETRHFSIHQSNIDISCQRNHNKSLQMNKIWNNLVRFLHICTLFLVCCPSIIYAEKRD